MWFTFKASRIYQVHQGINFTILGIHKFKQKGYNIKYSHYMIKKALYESHCCYSIISETVQ